MVVSRGKRKQKDATPSTPTNASTKTEKSTPDPIKRPKFQAQRKFAQGQGTSSSSTSAYLNLNSQQSTPVKDNREPPPELLPDKRPNTEDFLTFLCFRGTPVLPPELDFLNQGVTNKSGPSKPSQETIKVSNVKEDKEKPVAAAFPGAVRKQANKTPLPASKFEKKQNSVAALKKKYQEQRRVKANNDVGRRTRSNPIVETQSINDSEVSTIIKKGVEKNDKLTKKSPKTLVKEAKNVKIILKKEETPKRGRKVTLKKSQYDAKKEENIKKEEPKTEIERRQTRYASFRIPPPLPKKPRIQKEKNDESKNVLVPPVQKPVENCFKPTKSSSSAPPPPLIPIEPLKSQINPTQQGKKREMDFSSEDDEPLAKAIGKKTPTLTEDSLKKSGRRTKLQPKKSNVIDEIVKKLDDEFIPVLEVSSEGAAVVAKKIGRGRPPKPVSSPIPPRSVKSATPGSDPPKKRGRKPGKRKSEQSNADSPHEFSEPERATRPSRKTKEAATIYMELIGRKLSLRELSDDDSLDSLELPNIQKAQQLEDEMKANQQAKKEAEDEPETPHKKRGRKKKSDIVPAFKKNEDKSSNVDAGSVQKTEKLKVLEKSFSDSDEEPLAGKVLEPKKASTPIKKSPSPKLGKWQDHVIMKDSPSKIDASEVLNKTDDSVKVNRSTMSKVFSTESPKMSKAPFSRPMKDTDDDFLIPIDEVVVTEESAPLNLTPKSLLGNLLPSKEESQKIFGIASVSLAQSSGPLDTKCTLGKCGSIHKPPLGPAILTESNLGGHLSPKDRRKSKVNMTQEQIQKWIDEVSATPVPDLEFDDDLELTTHSTKISPYPSKDFDESSSSQRTLKNINKRVDSPKSSNSRHIKEETLSSVDKKEITKVVRNTPEKAVINNSNKSLPVIVNTTKAPVALPPKIEAIPPEVPKIILPTATSDSVKVEPKTLPPPTSQPAFETKAVTPSTSKTEAATSCTLPSCKVYTSNSLQLQLDKKPPRTPIYKQEPRPSVSKPTPPAVVNTFCAFSVENEKSIYSFDEDPDGGKTKSPNMKKRGRPSKNTSTDEFVKPTQTPPKAVSLTLTSEEDPKMAAIEVKESQDTASGNNADDSDGHTFYIPLQGAVAGGGKLGEVIQGVAVKLGTEGPEGPNQRVIMHAKLVTKAQMGEKTTPLPEGMGMANMQDIVKSLMSSKDGTALLSKSVPVGTVQPRFKQNEEEPAPGVLSRINSSSSLSSARSKPTQPLILPINSTATFPRPEDPAEMVEAPTFRPTEKEFQDPIEFFERIMPIASKFGICRVIPPSSFKPECRVSDDMRFNAYNQYIHKMLYRWGPSAKELAAIKKYLETQNISMQHPPWIGGMEVDLPRLYHTVQELGGLKEVIEKKKWPKVSEEMCIPKTAHDRVSKLDDIYCKYLLPYDTLSPAERQKLFDEVEADWAKQEAKARRNADRFRGSEDDSQHSSTEEEESSTEDEDGEASMECIVKGRSMPLNQFFRIARNTMSLWFKNAEPTSAEVEAEFWRHVAVRDSHVCVHSGSIDSSGFGYGFPSPGPKGKGSICAKHPWNLKVLTNNQGSILRSLGAVTGVTVPTLHVGMLFSACCWYRDPHGLPWIEYLHTGGSKVWYGVPDEQSNNFRNALTNLIPSHCQNKTIWLPCDTAMVPPHMLTDKGVSLCRTEQEPGQFVIVLPRAYTSSICTGYTVSESVMFASSSWLNTAKQDYEDMHASCEPAMFSLEQLLFAIATDQRSNNELLAQVLPLLTEVYEREKDSRKALKDAGVVKTEKVPIGKNKNRITEELECDICRANLSISMIKFKQENAEEDDEDEERIYCLHHALKNIKNERLQAKSCKIVFTYSIDEIESLVVKLKERMQQTKKRKNDTNSSLQNKKYVVGMNQPGSSR